MNKVAPFPIIGVGASAGGLRALESFFKPLPANPGMAFVIITHLAPDRDSLLTEILARHSAMPVEVAQDGMLVEPNKVYVLPPNAILTMSEGRLRLRAGNPAQHERAPIDIFFTSLARDCGEYAVGVVLSGSGSDGTLGVRAIKEMGGLTLAQAADASGPGFADMPKSAIASGVIDFAVPVDAMAAKLIDNALSFDALDKLAKEPAPGDDDHAAADARQTIYAILRAQTGHDFSGYKTRSFTRRVHRRMQVTKCEALADYVALLNRQPEEAELLLRRPVLRPTRRAAGDHAVPARKSVGRRRDSGLCPGAGDLCARPRRLSPAPRAHLRRMGGGTELWGA
jgi:two-component system CheB/CheR fusion protein